MSVQNESASTTEGFVPSGRRRPKTLKAAAIALAGLSAVFLFEMLDNSILNVALPKIGRELTLAGFAVTALAAVLVLIGMARPRKGRNTLTP